ncbi:EAL domain-containing protein [Vibrio harveyi]|uniref:EAL domain-containing protein n=2 Tax=Vibrio harveyi TaxID=669 RepID=UPI0003AAAE4B|nr:EAL domain-containing protein [Vibrio harveyi]UIL55493.1 EAL domain-containing protein [Vibrio harveyi]
MLADELNLCNNYMYRNVRILDNIFVKEKSIKFECQYQPIFNSRNNSIQFYEVVTSYPSGFNPYRECLNEIFIKTKCIKKILRSKVLGVSACISFKVESHLLLDGFFVQELMSFSEFNIAIEIHDLQKNIDLNLIFYNILRLQESGVMVWLSGYHENSEQANLSFGKINWDIIKIGKCFLSHNDFDAVEALYHVLKPFTRYGLIFEGVETSNQASMIRELGEFVQGKFYL